MAESEIKKAYDEGYQNGFSDRYNDGYEIGYKEGKMIGIKENIRKIIGHRRMRYPKCPYCRFIHCNTTAGNETYEKLLNMANGFSNSDIITCEHCGKQYKVNISIRFYECKRG